MIPCNGGGPWRAVRTVKAALLCGMAPLPDDVY